MLPPAPVNETSVMVSVPLLPLELTAPPTGARSFSNATLSRIRLRVEHGPATVQVEREAGIAARGLVDSVVAARQREVLDRDRRTADPEDSVDPDGVVVGVLRAVDHGALEVVSPSIVSDLLMSMSEPA